MMKRDTKASATSGAFTLADVREYLDNTNALDEAEIFLLAKPASTNIYDEKDNLRQTSIVTHDSTDDRYGKNVSLMERVKDRLKKSKNDPAFQRDILMNKLVSESHAGALALMNEEDELKKLMEIETKLMNENTVLQQEREKIATAVRKEKKSHLNALEKSAEADLLELEMQQHEIQKNLNFKKAAISKLHTMLSTSEKEIDDMMRNKAMLIDKVINSKNNPDEYGRDSLQQTSESRMQDAIRVAEQHAAKVAELRSSRMLVQQELGLLQRGIMPTTSSNSNSDIDSKRSIPSVSLADIDSKSVLTNAALSVIEAVTTDSGLLQQKKRIEMLRQQATKDAEPLSDYQFDSELNAAVKASSARGNGRQSFSSASRKNSSIFNSNSIKSTDSIPEPNSSNDNSSASTKRIPLGIDDRSMKIQDSLDKWLQEGNAVTDPTAATDNNNYIANDAGNIPFQRKASMKLFAKSMTNDSNADSNNSNGSSSGDNGSSNSNNGSSNSVDDSSMRRYEYSLDDRTLSASNSADAISSKQGVSISERAARPVEDRRGGSNSSSNMLDSNNRSNHPMHHHQQQQSMPYNQAAMMQQHPYQLTQFQQPPYNPYNPYNPYAAAPYMQQPYGAYNNPYMQQPYGAPPPSYQHPLHQQHGMYMDPSQNNVLSEMKKMAAQLENENSRLLTQVNGSSSGNSDSGDGGKYSAKFTRLQMKHQEDMKLLKFEMERLKQQKELEDLKVTIEQQKSILSEDLVHSKWLAEQKKELQTVKMKQAMAKEEKLLNMLKQQEEGSTNNAKAQKRNSVADTKEKLLYIDSGVGVAPVMIDVCKGVAIAVDGLLIAKEKQFEKEYRLAVAVYDAGGKALGGKGLLGYDYQQWLTTGTGTIDNSIQLFGKAITRSIQKEDISSSVGDKLFVEVQAKVPQGKSLGWGVINLTSMSGGRACNVMNGFWRMCILPGISDITSNPQTVTLPSQSDEVGWILVRIADAENVYQMNAWSAKDILSTESNTSLMALYQNFRVSASPVLPGSRPPSAAKPVTSRPFSRGNANADPAATAAVQKLASIDDADDDSDDQSVDSDADAAEKERAKKMMVDDLFKSARDQKIPWLLGTPTGPATEAYQRGDGIDLYIDAAMYLPDNVTITRVVVKFLTFEKEQILNPGGDGYCGYSSLSNAAISPQYKFKVDIRASSISTTAFVLLRFDTIDSVSSQFCTVGYSVLKLFCTRDRRSLPANASASDAYINTGSFQLPIKAGRVAQQDNYDPSTLLANNPRIPCSSILVRVLPSPKSSDGITVLSRDDFPEDEWDKLKLNVPAVPYALGTYDGSACEPTPAEVSCYEVKSPVSSMESVETSLSFLTQVDKFPDGMISQEERQKFAEKLMIPPSDMQQVLNYSYANQYSSDTGLKVCIDELYNVPDGSSILSSEYILYKVIYSMQPPGLYYKEPPLSEGVKFTKQNNFDRPGKNPGFSDGFVEFTPPNIDESTYLILDVRTVKILDSSTKGDEPKVSVESTSKPKKSYWSIVPLAKERVRGQGFRYVASGTYQLPLFDGSLPTDLLSGKNPLSEILSRLSTKGQKAIKLSDGASIVVRIQNPALNDLVEVGASSDLQGELLNTLTRASNSGGNAIKQGTFSLVPGTFSRQKTTAQLLSKIVDAKKFAKNINKAFASQTTLPFES